jgi:predicted O-methyltransferase YrrM
MTPIILGITNAISVAVILVLIRRLSAVRRRQKRKKARADDGHWKLKSVPFGELPKPLEVGQWGPTPSTEVTYVSSGDMKIVGRVSDVELWFLSAYAKDAKMIFEFGTCTGRTTYMLARNCTEDSKVLTITLGPEQFAEYQAGGTDANLSKEFALEESMFDNFYYQKTSVEGKIEQLFNDSKKLDVSKYTNQFDLIFVDGSHAYSYVISDTKMALAMIREGGVIFWHDYRGPAVTEVADVYRAMNELAELLPIKRVDKTSLVMFHYEPALKDQIQKAITTL